uniref:NADH-ubiquinone oxidoreductase chain 6 n=1 Tax=Ptilodactylidae sp. 2 ACP-2013 TaxID=1434563 RepID=A0A3G5FNP8_9COLE|nr:NADH dehydrogenase subunit 6 [Ptilodactylidae sp. 2 ACP-2013]
MITIMITSTFIVATMMLFIKHPLSMGLMIIIQSVSIAFITGSFYFNFWFSYLMFIVMVGGMMILFIYMTTIASNETFKMSTNLISSLIPALLTLIIFIYKNNSIPELKIYSQSTNLMNQFLLSINKFINLPANLILLTLIIYLFIVLIAVVKITNISHGPLRQNP